jgi:hypothetical protein
MNVTVRALLRLRGDIHGVPVEVQDGDCRMGVGL